MIEVIKHGKLKTKYTKVCPKCKCEFTFEESDIINSGSFFDIYYGIRCPECNMVDWDYTKDRLLRKG